MIQRRGPSHPALAVAGCCLIRDARDIVPFLCGHYLRIGVAKLLFMDDGSKDGTFEWLQRLGRKTGRIEVRRTGHSSFRQPQSISAAANDLRAEGYRLILPFDSDEFWHLDRATLTALVADPRDRVIRAAWTNFVQHRRRHRPGLAALFTIRHRAHPLNGEGMELVTGRREPFVRVGAEKVGVMSAVDVRFEAGQHALHTGPTLAEPERFEIFHVPLRNRSEIIKRGTNYEPRIAVARQSPAQSWQSRFHSDVVRNGWTDDVWAANSVDRHGNLDVYGRPIPAIRDDRLRHTLLRASVYLLRHGMVAL
jgi:hypothetical protein